MGLHCAWLSTGLQWLILSSPYRNWERADCRGHVILVCVPGPSAVLHSGHLINIWGGRIEGKKAGMEGERKGGIKEGGSKEMCPLSLFWPFV